MTKTELLQSLAFYQQRATILAQCIDQAGCFPANSWIVLERGVSGPLLVHTDPYGVPSGMTVDPEDPAARSAMWLRLRPMLGAATDDLLPYIRALTEYDNRPGKIRQRTA